MNKTNNLWFPEPRANRLEFIARPYLLDPDWDFGTLIVHLLNISIEPWRDKNQLETSHFGKVRGIKGTTLIRGFRYQIPPYQVVTAGVTVARPSRCLSDGKDFWIYSYQNLSWYCTITADDIRQYPHRCVGFLLEWADSKTAYGEKVVPLGPFEGAKQRETQFEFYGKLIPLSPKRGKQAAFGMVLGDVGGPDRFVFACSTFAPLHNRKLKLTVYNSNSFDPCLEVTGLAQATMLGMSIGIEPIEELMKPFMGMDIHMVIQIQ